MYSSQFFKMNSPLDEVASVETMKVKSITEVINKGQEHENI